MPLQERQKAPLHLQRPLDSDEFVLYCEGPHLCIIACGCDDVFGVHNHILGLSILPEADHWVVGPQINFNSSASSQHKTVQRGGEPQPVEAFFGFARRNQGGYLSGDLLVNDGLAGNAACE